MPFFGEEGLRDYFVARVGGVLLERQKTLRDRFFINYVCIFDLFTLGT